MHEANDRGPGANLDGQQHERRSSGRDGRRLRKEKRIKRWRPLQEVIATDGHFVDKSEKYDDTL
jgi:hypothetical protein